MSPQFSLLFKFLIICLSVMLVMQMHAVGELEKIATKEMQRNLNAKNLDASESDLNATVIGMATNYPLDTFQRFVGSLRNAGYVGHIILGVSPTISPQIQEYLTSRNIIVKLIDYVPCEHNVLNSEGCAHPYPDLKLRWSRFPLARDWLEECDTCTGPVLVTDVRDAFFQENPFGCSHGACPTIDGLQVFEENIAQTTDHWLVAQPVRACKNIMFSKPMLCSGTTIGTREAMLQYLNQMYEEMEKWINDPKCHFKTNGDDQSIHNYLFYTGQLPYATAIPPRTGIVNTVGIDGAKVWHQHEDRIKGLRNGDAYDKRSKTGWIGPIDFLNYTLTDEDGYFINSDGVRSRVIHQYDRFHSPLLNEWMEKRGFTRG